VVCPRGAAGGRHGSRGSYRKSSCPWSAGAPSRRAPSSRWGVPGRTRPRH